MVMKHGSWTQEMDPTDRLQETPLANRVPVAPPPGPLGVVPWLKIHPQKHPIRVIFFLPKTKLKRLWTRDEFITFWDLANLWAAELKEFMATDG